MKISVVLLICLFLVKITNAQFSNEWLNNTHNKHLLFANGDVMSGNNVGGGLGLSFVLNQKISLQVGYSATTNQFNTPVADMLKSGNNSQTNKILENYHIMFGRYFVLNSKGSVRIVLQAGPGLSKIVESVQKGTEKEDKNEGFRISSTEYLSATFNSRIEFPITQLFGFSAGPTLIVNSNETYLGVSLGVMYGILTAN